MKHGRKNKSDILKGNFSFIYETEIRGKAVLDTGTPEPQNQGNCHSTQ